MGSKLNSTEKALLARGMPLDLAYRLSNAGHTLNALRLKSLSELRELGIPEHIGKKVLSGRPPIPQTTLSKLMFDNKWVCCICRDEDHSVVVHHIAPWAISKSHTAENLVVLCPNHHSKAHSRGELAQNLTPDRLREAKARWERQVKQDDSTAIHKAAQTNSEYWYYLNLLRLHEIADHEGVDVSSLAHYREANEVGILDSNGHLVPCHPESMYAYSGRYVQLRYRYARDLFLRILKKTSIKNISDRFDRGDLGCTIVRNDLIYIEGAHTFRALNGLTQGAGQEVQGSRSANSVRIEFTFDRWFATSSSAHSVWLSGRVVVGSFCRVGDIRRDNDGKIIIKCTVLAICSELGLRNRSYMTESLVAHIHSLETEDETESNMWEL